AQPATSSVDRLKGRTEDETLTAAAAFPPALSLGAVGHGGVVGARLSLKGVQHGRRQGDGDWTAGEAEDEAFFSLLEEGAQCSLGLAREACLGPAGLVARAEDAVCVQPEGGDVQRF